MRIAKGKMRVSWTAVLFAIYCGLAPANMVLNFTGATINKYVGLIVAVAMCSRLLQKRQVSFNVRVVGPLFLFLIWAMATFFWSIDISTAFGLMVTQLSLAAVFMVGSIVGFNAYEVRLIKFVIVFVSAMLVFYVTPGEIMGRSTLQTSAGTADENGLAANMLFAMWIAIDQAREAKTTLLKIANCISAMLIIYSLLMIASRGALVALLISAILYFIVFHACKVNIALAAVLGIVGLLIYRYAMEANPLGMNRLTIEAIKSDGGTGRADIWSGIWDLLQKNPLRIIIGYGFGCEAAVGQLAIGSRTGTHNVYLELLATTGLIGLSLYLLFLSNIIYIAWKRSDYLGMTEIMIILTIFLVLGFSNDKGAWNMLLLTVLGFDHNQYKHANIERQLKRNFQRSERNSTFGG